ncbi:MAG: (d)CMP kinase [Rhodobacterales bacterium]|nr:(d)CMP kinase [Rhodobacterales bacterium]
MIATVAARAQAMSRPFILALDGRSGAGKSTLARRLADRLDASGIGAGVIEGDDFYAGGTALRTDPAEIRAGACIDWTRQRPVLADLRAGRESVWRVFDWDAFDGRLRDVPVVMPPKPVVIIEGVYAGRPELADLLDLKVLVQVEDATRRARLLAREGGSGPWERQWHEAEDHYFGRIMPPDRFDLILCPNAPARGWPSGD